MGIPKFVATLSKCPITRAAVDRPMTVEFIRQLHPQHVFVDANFIVYFCNKQIEQKWLSLYKELAQNKNVNDVQYIFNRHGFSDKLAGCDLIDSKDLVRWLASNVDTEVMIETVAFLQSICDTFPDVKISIVFDGVPPKRKMIDQRHSRYMMAILEELSHRFGVGVYDGSEVDADPGINEIRQVFNMSKLKITPGTVFMSELTRMIEMTLLDVFDRITVSDTNEPGEADQKISDEIKMISDVVVIYSPDADFILDSLLQPTAQVYLLQPNPNTAPKTADVRSMMDLEINVVNVSQLRQDLIGYFCKYSMTCTPSDASNTSSCVSNFVALVSLFGNDYLPKHQSLNLTTDLETILGVVTILENEGINLVENGSINRSSLKRAVQLLLPLEEKRTKYAYIYKMYPRANAIIDLFRKELPPDDWPYAQKMNRMRQLTGSRTPSGKGFKPFAKSVNSNYHRHIMEKNGITNVQMYQLQNLLDHYGTKFNQVKGMHRRDPFHIAALVESYICGLCPSHDSDWYYPYKNEMPTLAQIYEHLCRHPDRHSDAPKVGNDRVRKQTTKRKTDMPLTFTSLAHLIYTCPDIPAYALLIPAAYQPLHKQFHSKCDIIRTVDDILSSKPYSYDIDSQGCTYFNECALMRLQIPTQEQDRSFLDSVAAVARGLQERCQNEENEQACR